MKKVLIFALLFVSIISNATVFVWHGKGDGISWEDGDNWDNNLAPDPSVFSDVIINGAGGPTLVVDIASTVTIGRLRIRNCKLTIKDAAILNILNQTPPSVDTLYAAQLINSTLYIDGKLYMESTENDFNMSVRNSLVEMRNGSYFRVIYSDYGLFLDNGGIFRVLSGAFAEFIVDEIAILNEHQIDNQGKIVLNYGTDGLLNNGLVSNTDSLIFNGITTTAERGLVNTDSLNNQGFMDINNNLLFGIHNTGKIVNGSSAYLEVYKLGSISPMPGNMAFYNKGLFQNDGELYILALNEFGVYNSKNIAGFINNGTCSLSGADSLAFVNVGTVDSTSLLENNGTFGFTQNIKPGLFNNSFGTIHWNGKGLMTGKVAVENHGFIDTADSMKLQGIDNALLNLGKMEVAGTLDILKGTIGIYNQDSLIIEPSGQIVTSYIGGGILSNTLKNSGYLRNEGIINLTRGNDGILNENSLRTFVNNNEIHISGISATFLANTGTSTDSSYFINNGSLNFEIDGSPNDGIKSIGISNTGKASFINQGSVQMSKFWYPFDNIVNESKITNMGVFDFKETRGISINNSGTFVSTATSLSTFQCDENFNDFGIKNTGEMLLNGLTHFEYTDSYQRETPLIQNDGTITNDGKLSIAGGLKTSAMLNTGTFINKDSLEFLNIRNIGIHNSGTFTNESSANIHIAGFNNYIEAIILPGNDFENKGNMKLSGGGLAINVKVNETMLNSGYIEIADCTGSIFKINGANSKFHNQSGGLVEVSNIGASGTVNPGAVILDGGEILNQGKWTIAGTSDPGMRISAGELINDDSLYIAAAASLQAMYVSEELTNNGFLSISGAVEENVDLLFLSTSSTFYNNGTVELIDAFQNGMRGLGSFTTTTNSHFRLIDNNRGSAAVISHSNAIPVVYNGSMLAINSANGVSFSGAAVNNGYLDLRTCSISMLSGINSTSGHILSKNLSYIGQNNGIVEFFSDDLYVLTGTNLITNSGLMVDHGDAFRNINFNDGDALGYPIWNKGLFITPFYGTLSDGIKETINLNYTESGSLPLTTTWWTDRAKTTAAGTWDLTEHYFTPNATADTADSLFFEINLSGSNAAVIAIPHLKPTVCPQPIITKILRTKLEHSWNDHTSWRGNRAPGYCQRASFTGQEDIYVPSGYKVQINAIEFVPGVGPNRFLEIQSGAVFETNLLEFEN